VRRLRDRQEIQDCINAYCRGLDRLDADLLLKSYHPDARDRHGPFFGTRDEFVPWAIDLESKCHSTHHSVTTHNCEINGDTANAETYCVYFAVMSDGKTIVAGAARYIDQLERRDSKWAISARCEILDISWKMDRADGGVWESVPSRRDNTDLSYQRPLTVPADIPPIEMNMS
jgi:hypothetical protein